MQLVTPFILFSGKIQEKRWCKIRSSRGSLFRAFFYNFVFFSIVCREIKIWLASSYQFLNWPAVFSFYWLILCKVFVFFFLCGFILHSRPILAFFWDCSSHSTITYLYVVAEMNAHPEIKTHKKPWFFKGGSTQNRRGLMGDFSKGGVHKTDGLWWVIFQRGEYTKPMGFDGFWNVFFIASKN